MRYTDDALRYEFKTRRIQMTTTNEKPEGQRQRGPFYETTRTILLAGIGAVSLAQDEINIFLDRLVERGEMAEGDARKLVREVIDRREKLEKEHRQVVQEAKKPAAPVTRADLEALQARIADLTREIEELRKEHQA
jgi:polyhydroxyalkanoate synthesis regulator phasin